jgi:antitoxin MazE
MITKIQKWGNSLGLRIPKGVARGARVREGTTVTLAVNHGRLVVAPLETRGYELEALLAGVTRKNLHAAVDTGDPVGRERW